MLCCSATSRQKPRASRMALPLSILHTPGPCWGNSPGKEIQQQLLILQGPRCGVDCKWSRVHQGRLQHCSALQGSIIWGFYTGRAASDYLTLASKFWCVGVKFHMTPNGKHQWSVGVGDEWTGLCLCCLLPSNAATVMTQRPRGLPWEARKHRVLLWIQHAFRCCCTRLKSPMGTAFSLTLDASRIASACKNEQVHEGVTPTLFCGERQTQISSVYRGFHIGDARSFFF